MPVEGSRSPGRSARHRPRLRPGREPASAAANPSSACSSQMLRASPRRGRVDRSGPSRPGVNSSSSAAPASKSASSIRLRARSRRNRAPTAASSASSMASVVQRAALRPSRRTIWRAPRPMARVCGRPPRFAGLPPLMREEPRDVAHVIAEGSLEVRRDGRRVAPVVRPAAASRTRPHGSGRAEAELAVAFDPAPGSCRIRSRASKASECVIEGIGLRHRAQHAPPEGLPDHGGIEQDRPLRRRQ